VAEIRATRASPAIRATTEPRQTLLPERSAGGCSHRVIGNEPAEGPAHSIPRHVVARRVAGATSRRRPALTTAHHPCRPAAPARPLSPGRRRDSPWRWERHFWTPRLDAGPDGDGAAAVGRFQEGGAVTVVLSEVSEADRTPRISAQTADWRLAGAQGASLGRRQAPRNSGFDGGSVTGRVFAAEAGTVTGQQGP